MFRFNNILFIEILVNYLEPCYVENNWLFSQINDNIEGNRGMFRTKKLHSTLKKKLSFLQINHVTRNTFYNIGTDNSEIKEAFEIYLLFGSIS